LKNGGVWEHQGLLRGALGVKKISTKKGLGGNLETLTRNNGRTGADTTGRIGKRHGACKKGEGRVKKSQVYVGGHEGKKNGAKRVVR